MRKMRGRNKEGVTGIEDVTPDILNKDWEEITLGDIEFIKCQLEPDIVEDIVRIIVWFKRLGTGIDPRHRWLNAYKYYCWNLSGRPLRASYCV